MTGHGFDEQQPSPCGMVDDEIRHLAVLVDDDAERGEPLLVIDKPPARWV